MVDRMTDSVLEVSKRLFDLLVLQAPVLGIEGVSYGDQMMVPKTPWACIEPGTKRRPLAGASNMTENQLDIYILLYHSIVSNNPQSTGGEQNTRMQSVEFAEAVERWLHANHLQLLDALGDRIVYHGWCTELDPGYAMKGPSATQTLYNSVQITWTGFSKTLLKP